MHTQHMLLQHMLLRLLIAFGITPIVALGDTNILGSVCVRGNGWTMPYLYKNMQA